MLSLSPEGLAKLRRISDSQNASKVERICAQARLLQAEDDVEKARELLHSTIQTMATDDQVRLGARVLTVTAVLLKQAELASLAIKACVSPLVSFNVSIDSSTLASAPVTRISVSAAGNLEFRFFSETLASPNAEMYVSRWSNTLPIFERVSVRGLAGMNLMLSLEDQGTGEGLAFCDNAPGSFLIPDPQFVSSRGYDGMRKSAAAGQPPWEQRRPVAYWRGSTTGRPDPKELGWRGLPRVKLCQMAANNPGVLDAALTEIVQFPDEKSRTEIKASGLTAPRTSITNVFDYRYQIDIDGNTNSWPGLFQKLLSGGTVLKVASADGYRQWYYDRLKPWVHFVPIAANLEDLPEKVQWLRQNDSVAQAIAEKGRALATSMDYESELERGARTIEAAARHSLGQPEYCMSFGLAGDSNACLRSGWTIESDAAQTDGSVGTLDLPQSATAGEYAIDLELSAPGEGHVPVTVLVDGALSLSLDISQRKTIRTWVSLRPNSGRTPSIVVISRYDRAASENTPLVERARGVKLHTAKLVKVRDSLSAAAASQSQQAPTATQASVMRTLHKEDIWANFIPRGPRPESIQGWNGLYHPFKRFLSEAPNGIFVDVGVWKGQSTTFVAELMRQLKLDGCVISVDTFLGSLEHFGGKQKLFERIHGRPNLYETFLENVYYKGLTGLVVPLPQTSITAAAILKRAGIKAGVIHLDASHEYEDVARDAEVYWPVLESGGFLIGDDYHETWPGVVKAAHEFVAAKGLELTVHMPKWIVRKP